MKEVLQFPGVDLLLNDQQEDCLRGIRLVKHSIIGNVHRKSCLLQQPGVIHKLLLLLDDGSGVSEELLVEAAVTLGSLAKSNPKDLACLLEESLVPKMIAGLHSQHIRFVEACLRCLRTVYTTELAPIAAIYENKETVSLLLSLLQRSTTTQQCVAVILSSCCVTEEHRLILARAGAIDFLAPLLLNSVPAISISAVDCLTTLCYRNLEVSETVAGASFNGIPLLSCLRILLSRDLPMELQLKAAKCLTYMCRAGALPSSDKIIHQEVMPTLVRGCIFDTLMYSDDLCPQAAETLAYLLEEDAELQSLTAWNNQVLSSLTKCLNYAIADTGEGPIAAEKAESSAKLVAHMQAGALKAFASLCSNDEEIRRRIIQDVPGLVDKMWTIISPSLGTPAQPSVQLAAMRCLHSLSRSVHQLRTTFQEKSFWRPLIEICQSGPEDLAAVASAIICNLTVDFSPSRQSKESQKMVDSNAIEILSNFCKKEDPVLRLNGIWALMNLAYKSEEKLKLQILTAIGPENLLRLLTDSDLPAVKRLFGLLRNLLSCPSHVDSVMNNHGFHVMQLITYVLEGEFPGEVKEQALCVLANISHGDTAKGFVIDNDDILTKVSNYLNSNSNVRLQSAAAACIANLAFRDDIGSKERQSRLREFGVVKVLQQLLSTEDPVLFDKVKTAMQQFQST